MNARRDCPVGAAVGARRERSNRRSRHGSQTQIELSWDNQFRAEQQSPAMPEDHASTKREIRGNGNGNAEIPGRGPVTGRRERAAFVTARGGNESEMETARDTARGFETDYMSTAEPDTGRSLSTAFEVSTCSGCATNMRWEDSWHSCTHCVILNMCDCSCQTAACGVEQKTPCSIFEAWEGQRAFASHTYIPYRLTGR